MGLLQRVSEILKANINRILDESEDPQEMLEQLIQEMQENYRRSKIEVAKALADEKRLRHLMENNLDTAEKWGRKAALAVEKDDDDLAREALRRKRSYEDIAREFESQWTEQKKITDLLRENLFELESKIDEARRKKSLLVARQKRAAAQNRLRDTLASNVSEHVAVTMGRFEETFTELEARAEAEIDLLDGNLEGRFRDLERPGGIEDELASLKREIKSGSSRGLLSQAPPEGLEEPGAIENLPSEAPVEPREALQTLPEEESTSQDVPEFPETSHPADLEHLPQPQQETPAQENAAEATRDAPVDLPASKTAQEPGEIPSPTAEATRPASETVEAEHQPTPHRTALTGKPSDVMSALKRMASESQAPEKAQPEKAPALEEPKPEEKASPPDSSPHLRDLKGPIF